MNEMREEEKETGWKSMMSVTGVVIVLIGVSLLSFAFERTVEDTDDGYLVSPGVHDTMASMCHDLMGDSSAETQKYIAELNGMSVSDDALRVTTQIFFPFTYACVSESKDGEKVYGQGAWAADMEQVEDEAEAANHFYPNVNHRVEGREILLAGSYKVKKWLWDLVQ